MDMKQEPRLGACSQMTRVELVNGRQAITALNATGLQTEVRFGYAVGHPINERVELVNGGQAFTALDATGLEREVRFWLR